MRIVCWQTILMKCHILLFSKIRKDVTKFVVCCSRDWRVKGNVLKCQTLFMPPPTSGNTVQKQGPTLEISLPTKKAVGAAPELVSAVGEPIYAILGSFLASPSRWLP